MCKVLGNQTQLHRFGWTEMTENKDNSSDSTVREDGYNHLLDFKYIRVNGIKIFIVGFNLSWLCLREKGGHGRRLLDRIK